MAQSTNSAIDLLASSVTLPCGLILPQRFVKCPMQETCARPPNFDPPIEQWRNIYKTWAGARFGLLITGQVQVDIRYFSIAGDVCIHPGSLEPSVMAKWKEWAQIAQSEGTPCIVQLAHPGRMSPAGAGNRPREMPALCPSSVPVQLGTTWLDNLTRDKILGTPKAMTLEDIDNAVENFKRGAIVARDAGFAGIQLHAAHGFLISQFLSPHTNRRSDAYGGSPEKRMKFLKRLVIEIREMCPPPFCLAVKINSSDYNSGRGLTTDEALEDIKWLIESGMVDFIEISGGNAEQTSSKLHNSFGAKSLAEAPSMPARQSTRLREAFFTEFAERVLNMKKDLDSKVPIQLSGGFRSRAGMADAIQSDVCQMIGMGRTAVLEPTLPRDVLLNPEIPDDHALGMPHQIRGMWFVRNFPSKVVGRGLGIQFFYWNMRRLGQGLKVEPYASVPYIVFMNIMGAVKSKILGLRSILFGSRAKIE